MKVKVIAYGIARDIAAGHFEINVEGHTVGDLRAALVSAYPALKDLASLMIAVNAAYAGDEVSLGPSDEVVLIPPVSGG